MRYEPSMNERAAPRVTTRAGIDLPWPVSGGEWQMAASHAAGRPPSWTSGKMKAVNDEQHRGELAG
jgi:hypothetical protein